MKIFKDNCDPSKNKTPVWSGTWRFHSSKCFLQSLRICVSLHHWVAVSLYCKIISLRPNYASNQSPTSHVLAISYFFLYFVNVVLNSNEKVHRGSVFAVRRVKFWFSWKEWLFISTVPKFHIWNFTFEGWTQTKRKGINRWIWYIACNPITTVLILPTVKGHTAEGTTKQHTFYNASKEISKLSATQNSAILILQLALRSWSKQPAD